MSAPVLAITTSSSPTTSSIPRASLAPPVPPARTTTVTAAALPAGELGLALLGERPGALREVRRARAVLLQRDLELERRRERRARRRVDRPLGEPDRDG